MSEAHKQALGEIEDIIVNQYEEREEPYTLEEVTSILDSIVEVIDKQQGNAPAPAADPLETLCECGREPSDCATSAGADYHADRDDFIAYGEPKTYEEFARQNGDTDDTDDSTGPDAAELRRRRAGFTPGPQHERSE